MDPLGDIVEVNPSGTSATPEVSTPETGSSPSETPAPPSAAPARQSDVPSQDGRDELPARPSSDRIEPIPERPFERPGGAASGTVPRVLGAAAIAIGGYRFVSRPSAQERRRRTVIALFRP